VTRVRLPWQVSFLLLGLIWGCSFWWIKVGLTTFVPLEIDFGRLFFGSVALLVICLVTRTSLPSGLAMWGHLAVVALLFNVVSFFLFPFAEQYISSILAGIINATTPLATLVVVMFAFPEEQPSRDRIIGLLIGFIGVLIVLGIWNGIATGQAVGVVACLISVACFGFGFPYARRHLSGSGEPPIALATGQIVMGTLILLPIVGLKEVFYPVVDRVPVTSVAVISLLCLGVLSTGIAYVLNYQVLGEAGASVASAVTYITPVVAVFVGVLFLGETLTWFEPVGALVVLVGVAMSQGRLRRRKPVKIGDT
jgi:hypothetical protein